MPSRDRRSDEVGLVPVLQAAEADAGQSASLVRVERKDRIGHHGLPTKDKPSMFYLVLRVDREGRAIARGHVVTLPWSSHRWLNSAETASIVTASRRGQVITVTSPPRARSTVS